MNEPAYINPRPLPRECAVVGEDVIVKNPRHPLHNKSGEIWKVKDDGERLKISVSFDGEICNFYCEDLVLA